jgi:hypothetical protein
VPLALTIGLSLINVGFIELVLTLVFGYSIPGSLKITLIQSLLSKYLGFSIRLEFLSEESLYLFLPSVVPLFYLIG